MVKESERRWPIGQCPVCLGWGEKRQSTACTGCAKWRRAFPGQSDCLRCGHLHHVNGDGLCRACSRLLRRDHPDWIFHRTSGHPVQLALLLRGVRTGKAAPLLLPAQRAAPASTPETSLADAAVFRDRWSWWLSHPPVVHQVSPHLVDPAQITLFDARRNWSCLTVGTLGELPALTPTAQALIEEFDEHAIRHGWNTMPRTTGRKTLRLLLAWVGAEAPIHEADIRALADRRSTTIRRVLQFLDAKGMVIPDPARQGDPIERALHRRIAALPDGIAEEMHHWMLVLRGQGRRPHAEFPFTTIRTYYNALAPVLNIWSDRVTSLREITPADIQTAIDDRPPATAHNLLPALRSLFRALKQERLIFRDPTHGATLAARRHLPTPIPPDQLRGLIDRANGPMAKLVIALVVLSPSSGTSCR